MKMKKQNAFCCFQKTLKFSSLFFLRTPLFLRMFWGQSSFYKDGGGPRGTKNRGMHPPFYYGLRLQGGFTVEKGSEKGLSRRCLERPLGKYDPWGVHPFDFGQIKIAPLGALLVVNLLEGEDLPCMCPSEVRFLSNLDL